MNSITQYIVIPNFTARQFKCQARHPQRIHFYNVQVKQKGKSCSSPRERAHLDRVEVSIWQLKSCRIQFDGCFQ